MPVLELHCPVMNYDWGALGAQSLVAELFRGAVDPQKPYAELWVGAHPKAPARVGGEGGDPLDAFFATRPEERLGSAAVAAFGPQLPFLLKVLDIAQPLSIQAHPQQSDAVRLHSRFPELYPDPSHKPEIAYALSAVSMLRGLRTDIDPAELLQRVPELEFLGSGKASARELFESLLKSPAAQVGAACRKLWTRIESSGPISEEERWVLALRERFPEGDRGILCFFLLRLEEIPPGRAVYTPAGVPHAYLRGRILECMASSDNVIRVGLTSKHVDLETMLEILPREERSEEQVICRAALGIDWYFASAKEFRLGVAAAPLAVLLPSDGVAHLLLSIDASGELQAGEQQLRIAPGTAAVIPASEESINLKLISGRAAIARVNL